MDTVNIGDRLRHIKRGTTYVVRGIGILSIAPDLLTDETEITPHAESELVTLFNAVPGRTIGVQADRESTPKTLWVLYACTDAQADERVPVFWLRPLPEFSGRFVHA